MAEIINTALPLAPPGCGYANEQDRWNAYVAALLSTLVGGIEWQASVDEPEDLSLHWLKLDADGRVIAALEYSDADARYVRWISTPVSDGVPAGAGGLFTLTFTPAFNVATAQQSGRRYVFVANHTITGPASLNVDGTGAVPIVKHAGDALASGDIRSGQIVDVVISGGNAWLQTPIPPQAATSASVRGLFAQSTEFDVPAQGAATSTANVFGVVPATLRIVAVCKIAVDGYVVDDELDISGIAADFDASEPDGPAYTISASSSDITVAALQASNGQTYAAKTGGNADWGTAVAGGSWKLKAYYL